MGARAAAAGGGAWGGGGGAAAVAREPLAGGGTAALRCLRSAAAERALDAAPRGGPGRLPPLGPRQPGTPRVERRRPPLPPGASPSGLRAAARPAPLGRTSPSLPLPPRSPQRPGKKLPRKLPQAAGRQHGRLGAAPARPLRGCGLAAGGGRQQRRGRSWARRFPPLRYLLERGRQAAAGAEAFIQPGPAGRARGGTAPGAGQRSLREQFCPQSCVLVRSIAALGREIFWRWAWEFGVGPGVKAQTCVRIRENVLVSSIANCNLLSGSPPSVLCISLGKAQTVL